MNVAHLASSQFLGGPERQMLGLAQSLPAPHRTVFLLFVEGTKHQPFLEQIRRSGFEGIELERNWPHAFAVIRELSDRLRGLGTDVLCCHGYKANLLGHWAARRAKVPAIAISRGWTGHTTKVRLYEAADRLAYRWMDHVVCVSEGQAAKVRRLGVPAQRVTVIRNAILADRFGPIDPTGREVLAGLFPRPYAHIVGAAGRLSPEKGFEQFVAAAALIAQEVPDTGFILFGNGPSKAELARQITELGLDGRVVLAGHRTDLDHLLPHLTVLVLSSFTEGLPNILLEAAAATVPIVATAVGGVPEIVADGANGYLVSPGDPALLAQRTIELLRSPELRAAMGQHGRERARSLFTFESQSQAYINLFDLIARPSSPPARPGPDPTL